jgi:signal transduction histidine kinase
VFIQTTTTKKANEDIYNLMISQQTTMDHKSKGEKRVAQELHDGVLGRMFGVRMNLDGKWISGRDGCQSKEWLLIRVKEYRTRYS